MLSDLPFIYLFWLTIFVIGFINLPLTFLLFKRFIDRGYIFSKILGIALSSYLVWLLSSLKILPFTTYTIAAILVVLGLVNLYILRRGRASKENPYKITSSLFKLFLFEELLFTAGLFFWTFIRGFEPSIHGLEKFMDFGFVNSILRTKYMPPLDMWLAASSEYPKTFINYYYYGHFVTALLTKISTVPAEISYNIMIGVLFGFTFTAPFSIASNLIAFFQRERGASEGFLYNRKTLACGLLAGFLVALGGNLHTIYAFTRGYSLEKPQPPWELLGKPSINTYWYPNATRFILNTIHEFPIYSFVVSDLHGHVLDIPFVLLIIAFLFSMLITYKNSKLLLLGLLLAIMYMTNAWDGIIYLGLSGLVLLVINTHLLSLILNSCFLILSFILFSLPFNRHFIPFAKGIGINCLTPNATNQVLCDHSPIWMLLILWGYFFYFALSFILLIVIPTIKTHIRDTTLTKSDIFVTLLILLSTILLIAPEFIFARDIYPTHYRANTMFKLGYQAFMMLGIVVAYVLFRFLEVSPFGHHKLKKALWLKLALIQLFLVAIYPIFAINSYYNGLKNYQGLNGLLWLSNLYPQDYEVVEYFRKNIPPFAQPTILEGVGDSYTDYARISANCGLPTVLGWPVHEWLWRGSYDEAGKRQEEVRRIYEGQDLDEVKRLLEKYRVEYVVIGRLEQEKYPNLNEGIFYNLGTIVFNKGSIRVYRLNP